MASCSSRCSRFFIHQKPSQVFRRIDKQSFKFTLRSQLNDVEKRKKLTYTYFNSFSDFLMSFQRVSLKDLKITVGFFNFLNFLCFIAHLSLEIFSNIKAEITQVLMTDWGNTWKEFVFSSVPTYYCWHIETNLPHLFNNTLPEIEEQELLIGTDSTH